MSTKKRKNIQYIEVGNRIKSLRKSLPGSEKKFTIQGEFARLLGIGKSTLVNYENGRRDVSGEFLINIARLCNISIDWILTGQGSELTGKNESPMQSDTWSLETLKWSLAGDSKFKRAAVSALGENKANEIIKSLLKTLDSVDIVVQSATNKNHKGDLSMSDMDSFNKILQKDNARLEMENENLKKELEQSEKLRGVR
jgi:transcriptional regulator with XRE-family HTH domain